MTFIWITSLLPILFSILVHLLKSEASDKSIFWTALVKSFNPGEIIIYAITALAPVAYVMYKYNRDKIKFPDFWAFSLLLIIIIGAGSFSFAMHKVGDIRNAVIINMVAFVLYLIALVIWYISLVYDDVRGTYPNEQRRQEGELKNQLRDYAG